MDDPCSQDPRTIVIPKTYLLVDDLAVNFSSGDVIIAAQSDIEVAFVVAEVEVDLATVV